MLGIASLVPVMIASSPTASLSLSLACACGAFFALGAHDGSLGVLLPQMAATYHISRAAIGLPYVGAACGYILACLAGGWLACQIGRKPFLLLGIGCFCFGTLILGFHPPLFLMKLAPLAIGFGAGISELSWNERISATPEPAPALNALHASFGIGAIAGPLTASLLLSVGWSWPSIFRAIAIVGAIVGLVSQVVLPPLPKSCEPTNNLFKALSNRSAIVIALSIFFFMGTEFALGDWNFSFLVEWRGTTAAGAGGLGSGYWLGIAGGRVALAVSNLHRERAILSGCFGCIIVGTLLLWFLPQTPAMAAGLFLTGLGLGPILPTALALLAKEISGNLLLGALSLVACLGSFGKGILPWLCGLLLDRASVSVLPACILALVIGMNFCLLQFPPARQE